MGISLAGVFKIEGMLNEGGELMVGNALYPYQLEFSALLSECFHMSFQSGAVFCNSQAIRGFPCQEITNRTPELEFRVYHRM